MNTLEKRKETIEKIANLKNSLINLININDYDQAKTQIIERNILIENLLMILDTDGVILDDLMKTNTVLSEGVKIMSEQMNTIASLSQSISNNALEATQKYIQAITPSLN